MAYWALATAMAFAAHVALLAWTLEGPGEPDADDPLAGSIVVELAPVMTSSALDSPPAPPGLLSRDQAASPELVTAAAPPPAGVEQPMVPPSPREPEPDLAMPEKTRVPQTPESLPTDSVAAKSALDPAAATDASQAAAPPKIEAPLSTASAAPERGMTPSASRAKASWGKILVAHLERHKRYPQAARAQAATGTTFVEFTIDRSGQVTATTIAKSSGSRVLDDAALEMLARASPLPAPPKDQPGQQFTLTVPILFRMP